jgi:hypothetical protein
MWIAGLSNQKFNERQNAVLADFCTICPVVFGTLSRFPEEIGLVVS